MRITYKRGNKKKNKARGLVSRRNTERRLSLMRNTINSFPIPDDATHDIFNTYRQSKFIDNLREKCYST